MNSEINILSLIEKDHQKVEMLLSEFLENAKNTSKRTELLTQLKQELLAHNRTEESLVYKELKKKGNDALAIKSQEEHNL